MNREIAPDPGYANGLRLLELLRAHDLETGSGVECARLIASWTDEERAGALRSVVPLVISLASEVAPNYGLSIPELIDRWEASVHENERQRIRIISKDSG
jgi:hypothetical protein